MDQKTIEYLAAQTVAAWKEAGRPLSEMDDHQMTEALGRKLGLVMTPGAWGRLTVAIRAAKGEE
jgi:hypothetical protein